MKKIIIVLGIILIGWQSVNAQCLVDRHSTTWYESWISCDETPNPNTAYGDSHWILYNLGHEYTIFHTKLWNLNDTDNLNNGILEYSIDYSMNGTTWTHLGTFSANQADGSPTYQGEEGPNFDGVSAHYVLLTPLSNHGGACYGISEIKFFLDGNSQPIVNNDTDNTDEDTSVVINVLANDSDIDGSMDITSVTQILAPTYGTLSINATTGVITYTPNPNFNGTDTFEYQACDNEAACATALVTLTVNPINDAPIANDDTETAVVEVSVTTIVLANDTDLNDPLGNIDPNTVSIVSDPANGSVIVNTDGTITYTSNADFIGNDTYVYSVCDDGNPTPVLCDDAMVTITVGYIGVEELNNLQASVFPNPFSNSFEVVTKNANIGETINYSVYDLLGRLVLEKQIEATYQIHRVKINMSNMQTGLYTLKIRNADKEKIMKIVKK